MNCRSLPLLLPSAIAAMADESWEGKLRVLQQTLQERQEQRLEEFEREVERKDELKKLQQLNFNVGFNAGWDKGYDAAKAEMAAEAAAAPAAAETLIKPMKPKNVMKSMKDLSGPVKNKVPKPMKKSKQAKKAMKK